MVDYRPGAKKIQEEPGTFMVSERVVVEEHKSQLEGQPIGTIPIGTKPIPNWNNLRKKEKIVLDYSPQNKICMDSY